VQNRLERRQWRRAIDGMDPKESEPQSLVAPRKQMPPVA
jgi:hypothetical protein